MATCYRHPDRETGVSCSNCGRPICPDCMTPTPVGMRCPECARQRTPVRTLRSLAVEPTVTYALIAINVLFFVAEFASGSRATELGGGTLVDKLSLYGPGIADDHQYYRLVTGGFLHAGFLHIAFNMYLLYLLGQLLEPGLGHVRFAVLYAVSLLAGSFGALLVDPTVQTVGASGAVFGLMGGGVVALRARGIDPMASGLGPTIIFNLLLSFLIPGISIGGHIGGLIGGAACGWLLVEFRERQRSEVLPLLGCLVIGVGAVVGAIMAAGSG
jgi:membrane associated rhomboid family serine protease